MRKINKKDGYISTKYIILFSIVVVIVFGVLKYAIPNYLSKLYKVSYDNEVQKITNALDNLPFWENEKTFFSTSMYAKETPSDYTLTAGNFLNKYIGISRECTQSDLSDCFGANYKNAENKEFKPDFTGACAVLKSGASICIKPQIGNDDITGVFDANGASAPNVEGKDFYTFTIKAREREFEKSNETSEVELLKL